MDTVKVVTPSYTPPNLWDKTMTLGSVILLGRQGDVSSQLGHIMKLGRKLHASQVHILRPPAAPDQLGWHKVATEFASQGEMTFAEGGILPGPGHCMMIPTRDCYVIYLEDLKNGRAGATHAGRPSLIKGQGCCGTETVVHSLLQKLEVQDGKDVHAYITGGISAKHFTHPELQQVQPFMERYGSEVVTDPELLTLDLLRVIRIILNEWGVPDEQISHDGLCTFEEEYLGSKRAERAEQNWVFVHQHRS